MTHVQTYIGIEDMPICRYNDFTLALLVEAGAGGGVAGLESMLMTAYRHIANKEPDKAGALLLNSLQNIAFAKEGITPASLAYAATVHKIGNEDVSGLTAEQVAQRLDLTKEKIGRIQQAVQALKKKWTANWQRFIQAFQNRRSKLTQHNT